MELAVPNLTSPRVYLITGGPGTHLSGLNKLFYKCRFFRFFRPTGVNPGLSLYNPCRQSAFTVLVAFIGEWRIQRRAYCLLSRPESPSVGVAKYPNRLNWVEGLSCNGRRIGQDDPHMLKHGPIDLWRAFCKKHLRLLESDNYFQFYGVPKMTPIDLCLTSGQTAPDDPYTLEYITICLATASR